MSITPPEPIRVELAPFDETRHLQQLCKWLKEPLVARWWGDSGVVLSKLARYSASRALILGASQPVGFLCWQNPTPEELAATGLNDLPSDLVDIDILIGEPAHLGQDIGPRALGLLLERLAAEGCTSAGLATAFENKRARRAFEKAGFRAFRDFEEQGQRMVYLIRSLPGKIGSGAVADSDVS